VLGDRDGGPDPALGRVDARGDAGRRIAAGDGDLRRDEQGVRPDVQGPQVNDPVHLGTAHDGRDDLAFDVRAGRLADEQALHLDRQDRRHAAQQDADRDRAGPVPPAVAGGRGQRHPGQGEDQAGQRGYVLQQDRRQLRGLGPPDEAHPAGRAPGLVGLADRRAEREALQSDGDEQDRERDGRRGHLLGPPDPLDALVEGEQRAHGKQHQGDDERVEVPLGPEAELMFLGLLLQGTVPAEQQQRLVARVGHRMRGLGQQRR